jgi:uncharacterized SAM-binding protein YcdF (DUF218 family)
MRKRIGRLLKKLMIVVLVGIVSLILFGVYIYAYGQADRAVPSDVIIVLGAGTRPSGAPSVSHARRIRHAVTLYQRGYAPYMLCTGGYTARHPKSEARACADLAQGLGVPADVILMEENSRSTEENAIESRKVMQAKGLNTAILVTDNYHLWRAEMLFRTQGIAVTLSPAQATAGPLHWRAAFGNTTREVAATGWYVYKTVLGLPVTDAQAWPLSP